MIPEEKNKFIERHIDFILKQTSFKKLKNSGEKYCPCYFQESCHPEIPEEELNCLFCYCPEYDNSVEEGGCKLENPLGKGKWFFHDNLSQGKVWDCSDCEWPHRKENVKNYLRKFYDLGIKKKEALNLLNVKIKKLDSRAVIPHYSKKDDAAMDVYCIDKEETEKYLEYKTGLSFEIPKGYFMLVFPRSSISDKDLLQCNSVGVVDSGYRGELKVRYKKFGEHIYEIGERIAQIMILPYPQINFQEVEELENSERGDGGFGSTGK